MNNERRKTIDLITKSWHELHAQREALRTAMEILRDDLQECRDQEEEALENLPDSFKEGEQGETMQSSIDILDTAFDEMEELIDSLDEDAYENVLVTLEGLPT